MTPVYDDVAQVIFVFTIVIICFIHTNDNQTDLWFFLFSISVALYFHLCIDQKNNEYNPDNQIINYIF